ncbi:Major facilitator superfamily protein [Spironucleus salmonicida]|uniref:Major facilitator superfamily protein n=1 Tax=Spironucleus salmonicida TaxID=348837 RepID=V6LUY6_9EUKA|nr:Major facilitator superfamily protein [Spironucleus salmonicida]|eukprot:EST47516.1 Major facilitator superfamily protein [Spironucleus salmonicida]
MPFKSEHLKPNTASFIYASPFLFFSFLNWKFDEIATNNALPFIQDTFSISKPLAQWLQSAYFIATAAFAIPFNKLGDIFGLILICQICAFAMALFQFPSAFLNNFWALLVFKFVCGAIAAGAVANRNALLSKFNYEKSREFIANALIVNGVAGIIIPLIAGAIIDKKWQMIFVFSGFCSLISFILSLQFTNVERQTNKPIFDIFGSVLIIFGVGGLCVSLTFLSQKQWILAGVSLFVFVAATTLFFFLESSHPEPVLPLFLMKNPVAELSILHVLGFICFSANQYLLPQVFSHLNAKSILTGGVQTASQITNVLTALAQKFIGQKIVNRYALNFSLFGLLVSLVLQSVFVTNVYAYAVFYTFAQTFNTHLTQVYYPMLLLAAPKKYTQLLAGIPTSARTIGNSLSYCFFSYFQELTLGLLPGDSEKKFYGSIVMCQVVIMVIVIIMLIIVIFRVGNTQSEFQKLGYKEKQVRELNVDEDKVQRIRDTYFQKKVLKQSKKLLKTFTSDHESSANVQLEI